MKMCLAAFIFSLFVLAGISMDCFADSHSDAKKAKEITINKIVTDTLESPDAQHWYKFKITEPGYFRVCLGPNAKAAPEDIQSGWRFYVYKNGSFNEEISLKDNIIAYEKSQYIAFSPDTYYIKVINERTESYNATNNAPFDLKVEFTKSNKWEQESNDSFEKANAISVNSVCYGSLYRNEDEDWFKYTVTEDGIHSFSMAPDAQMSDSDSINDGWDYAVYSSIRKIAINSKTKVIKLNYSKKYQLKKGTYYIRIKANGSFDNQNPKGQVYNFKVNFEPYKQAIARETVNVSKVKAAKKKATIKWKKISYASGYEIYRSTKAKKGFKKVATVSSKKNSYVNKKLKSKKTYYYKVRAYKKIKGKKYYSNFSHVKKVKVK